MTLPWKTGFLLVVAIHLGAGSIFAGTITVTSTADAGAGSLRQAVIDATSGDTINFTLTYPATITLTGGEIAIAKTLTFSGPGANNLSVSGNNASRIFNISSGYAVAISGLSFKDATCGNTIGGAIYCLSPLTLTACSFTNCYTVGGDYKHGGAIFINNTLTADACLFSNCRVGNLGAGGAIEFDAASNNGLLTGCTFTGCQGYAGAAIDFNNSAITVTNCTFSGNLCTGGGNDANNGTLWIQNGTVVNCTIVNNTTSNSDRCAGIRAYGSVILKNNIISLNGGDKPNVFGAFTSQGGNVIGTTTGGSGTWLGTDTTGTADPLLYPLANNGGPTQTCALKPASPALNYGVAGGPATDQRGFTRDASADSGAYESISNVWTNGGGTGNWNLSTNWSLGHVPVIGEIVLFTNNTDIGGASTASCNAANDTVAQNLISIEIRSGYTGTLTFAANFADAGTLGTYGEAGAGSQTLTVTGDVTVNGGAASGGLVLTGRVIDASTGEGVTINCANFTVASGKVVHADALGFNTTNRGPGGTTGGGATHGGRGSSNALLAYGSATAPVTLGSGTDQGAGGGAIRINAGTGTISIAGTLRANGQWANFRSGAGGSLYLAGGTFTGGGLVQASGGNAVDGSWGQWSGGGGRIAVSATTMTFTGNFDCKGGTVAVGTTRGQPGTLVVPNGTNLALVSPYCVGLPSGTNTLGTVSVASGSLLFMHSTFVDNNNATGCTLNATSLTIAAGGQVSANHDGFSPAVRGPGGTGGGGGTHGGRGTNNAATAYGSATAPITLGSATDLVFGGGAIKVDVGGGSITVAGSLTANGEGSTYRGGAGGSIHLICGLLTGGGQIQAAGGSAWDTSWGYWPGGGGRIALQYTSSTFSGSTSVAGGIATMTAANNAEAGSLVPGNLTLSAHAAGQQTDRFSIAGTYNNTDLYRWKFTTAGNTDDVAFEEVYVTQLVFDLTGVSGLASGDITNVKVLYDSNGDGVGDSQLTTASTSVNITGASGTITANFTGSNLSVDTKNGKNYILQADVAGVALGDGLTVQLSAANTKIAAAGATLGRTVVSDYPACGFAVLSGSTTAVTHAVPSAGPIVWTNAAGGNTWNTNGNWDLGRVPLAGDQVTFSSGYNFPCNASAGDVPQNLAALTLNSGYTETVTFAADYAAGPSQTLTLSGDVTVQDGRLVFTGKNRSADDSSGQGATLNCANFTVGASGIVHSDGLGCLATHGPGGGAVGQGGAHGGRGASNSDAAYGSATAPLTLGSGGGDGSGGGALKINAGAGTVTISGALRAQGSDTGSPGTGGLNSWAYRKSHGINGAAGAGTGYQVKLTIYKGAGVDSAGDVYLNGHCRDDFGDLRFTAADGATLLNYWIESKTDGVSATVWVQVAADLGSNQTIYVYYANSGATTTSNGNNTFLFFDDFNDNSLRADWATNGGTWNESGQVLAQTATSSGDPKKAIVANSGLNFGANHEISLKVRVDSWVDGDFARAGASLFSGTGDGRGYNLLFHNNHSTVQFLDDGVSWGPSYTFNWSTAQWYRFRMKTEGGTLYGKVWADGSAEPSNWPYQWTRSGRSGYPALNGGSSNGGNYATTSFEDVTIRKVNVPEPSHGSWGSEEVGAVADAGAGGSLFVLCNTLAGSGTISARGGNGTAKGGGGGRIALQYATRTFNGTLSVAGGTGTLPGEAGSITPASLTLADHPNGQLSSLLSEGASKPDQDLYRFRLTTLGNTDAAAFETVQVTGLVFTLSGVSGFSSADLANLQLFADSNSNGSSLDDGAPLASSGTNVSIAGSSGTLTLNFNPGVFLIDGSTAKRDFILQGDLLQVANGDTLNIGLGATDATLVASGTGLGVQARTANLYGFGRLSGNCASGLQQVSHAPTAVADSYMLENDAPLLVAAPGVLANDTDLPGTPLTAVLANGPAHGTLALNAAGSFSYQPHAGFTGTDSFSYQASNGVFPSNTVTVTLAVFSPLRALPSAAPAVIAAGEQTILSGTATGGSGNYASFLWTGPNGFGSSQQSPGALTLSAAGYYSLTLTVVDAQGFSDTASVMVAVIESALHPNASATPDLLQAGGTVQLGCAPTGGTGSYVAYAWSGPDGFSSTLQNPPALQLKTPGTHIFAVTVTDAVGLVASESVGVVVGEPLNAALIKRGGLRYSVYGQGTPEEPKDWFRLKLWGLQLNPGDRVALRVKDLEIGDLTAGDGLTLDSKGQAQDQLGEAPNTFLRCSLRYQARQRKLLFLASQGVAPTGGAAVVQAATGTYGPVQVAILVDRAPADGIIDTAAIVPLMVKVRTQTENGTLVMEAGSGSGR